MLNKYSRSCEFNIAKGTLTPGTPEDEFEDDDSLQTMEFSCTPAAQTRRLILGYIGTPTISWGDGSTSILPYSDSINNKYTYTYAKAKTYHVTITGDDILKVSITTPKIQTLYNFNLPNYTGITGNVTLDGIGEFEEQTALTIDNNCKFSKSILNYARMFFNCKNITSLNGLKLDDATTNVNHMFYNCEKLTQIPNTLVLTDNITHANYMFYGCSQLEQLPPTFLLPDSVKQVRHIFNGCASLTNLPNNFIIPDGISHMDYMFYNCGVLESDVTNVWPIEWLENNIVASYLFYNCRRIIGIVPENKLWKLSPSPFGSNSYAFYNCTSLDNYNSIPSNWK